MTMGMFKPIMGNRSTVFTTSPLVARAGIQDRAGLGTAPPELTLVPSQATHLGKASNQ